MNQKQKEPKDFYMYWWFWIIYIFSIFKIGIFMLINAVLLFIVVYKIIYFDGHDFKTIKTNISQYINDCNELNDHIGTLQNAYANFSQDDYGDAQYTNISRYQYKKSLLGSARNRYIYDCSRTVCSNASKQPFKYICKYFNISADNSSIEEFGEVLNEFIAANEGKELLIKKKKDILNTIAKDIPYSIRTLYPKTLVQRLGFNPIAINDDYYPSFTFRYISAGGNSGNRFDVQMNPDNLERFIQYLSDNIKYRQSVAYQRLLMTPRLRQYIIERDHHTCKICGNSTFNEPNLLLEVDHIIPISKGGLTTEDNLQTLCWKCNRHKGANI